MELIRPVKMTPDMIVSTTAVDTEPEWASGETCSKGARRIYNGKDGPSVYQSAADGNEGHQPDASPDDWVRVGPTNRWALFDGSASTLSASENGFEIAFQPGEAVDSLAFFEVQGTSITVKMTIEPDNEVVFQRTIPLLNDAMIVDWYTYFFEPFDFIRDGVIKGLPPYGSGATIYVSVEGGGEVGVGEIVTGTLTEIGETERGAKHGIRDYSQVKEDTFGNVYLQQGAWAKRGDFSIFVDKARLRYVSRTLTDLRGTPIVIIGSDDPDYEPLIIFGFIKEWLNAIDYPSKSLINLDIQGLK